MAWSAIIEPGTPYVHGYHLDAMYEHLEAVTTGEIKRLIINIPPRHMKSLGVCVAWPTWAWISNPQYKWLFTSYGFHLVTRDAIKSRQIIRSLWYQDRWGDKYQISEDQDTQDRYNTDKGGFRISASVSGKGTGDGGDFIIADDPHNTAEAESEVIRLKTVQWWREVMSTRLNDLKTGRRVIIMQRQHMADLAGAMLEETDGVTSEYEHLCLPLEFEPSRLVPHMAVEPKLDDEGEPIETEEELPPNPNYVPPTCLGFVDWREEEGELLWPEKNGPNEVRSLKRDMGTYAIAGQLQQRPAPRGGGMFQREWFEIVKDYPREASIVRYWDVAASKPRAGDAKPDWTVGLKMARTKEGVTYIVDVRRMQATSLTVERAARQCAYLDGLHCRIFREQEPGAAGKDIISYWSRHVLQGFPFLGHRPTGPKEERAGPLSAQAENGNVKLVLGPWNETFLAEVEVFPVGEYDDQVDAASGAYVHLATGVVPRIRSLA